MKAVAKVTIRAVVEMTATSMTARFIDGKEGNES